MSDERRLVRLSQVQPKPLKWIWPGYIPVGAIVDFSGDPGAGKSRVAYDLTARVTTGQPMPCCAETALPAGVVLLQGEDVVESVVRPALASAGADLSRIFTYRPKDFADQPLTLPDDLALIKEAAAEVQAKLLVIDPVTVFVSCNFNSDRSVRKALQPLTEFAADKGLAILLVRHLNKSNLANPLYQASGSIGWIAAARTAIRAINDPTSNEQHRHLLVQIKTNLPGAATLAYRTVMVGDQVAVEWLGTSGLTVKDLVRGDHEDAGKLWEAMEILFLILREEPRAAREVIGRAREEGVAKRTLDRAKCMLRIKSERKKSSWHWHWIWRLPDEDNQVIQYLRDKYDALDSAAQEENLTQVVQ